jgi:hypothetical protein
MRMATPGRSVASWRTISIACPTAGGTIVTVELPATGAVAVI